ncbi:MAG: PAS domain-containing sensor histidine kinase [Myxococcales bacterium]
MSDRAQTTRRGTDRVRRRGPAPRALTALLEAVNEGAATLSEDGVLTWCNARFAEILARPRRRLRGAPLSAFVAPEDRDVLGVLLGRGRIGESLAEVALLARGATRVPACLALRPLRAGGRPLLGAVVTDLSEQKHSEEMLAAEQLTRSMLEQAAEAIVVCDEEGVVIRASRAARRLCGGDPLLKPFRAAFPVRLSPRRTGGPRSSPALVAAALRGGVRRGLEGRLSREDGAVFDLQLSAGPLRGPRGRIVGCVVTLTDVSAHRRAETDREQLLRQVSALARHLAHQEKWLQGVLDSMPIPLVLAEPGSGRVTFANDAADRITGGYFAAGAPAGDRRWSATGPYGTPLSEEELPVRRAVRGERLEGDEVHWCGPHGRPTLMSFSERLPALHGHPEAVVVSFLDISKLKQAEQELQDAIRVRDEFLSIASHELKTPLTTMSLQVDGMLRAGAAHPERRLPDFMVPKVETMRRQCDRLAKLINDLLDVSRIRAGRLELVLEEVNLGALAREVCDRFFHEANAAGSRIEVDAEAGVVGRWDRGRLDQVLTNLVSNAIKYGAGRPIRVEVAASRRSASVSVRDQGIGIAREHQERIFNRFERAVSSQNFRGMGLGLWIAREIVERLGGAIALDSEPGRGSCFTASLPLRARVPRPAAASAA